MAITVAWDNEAHGVLCFTIIGSWNWLELSEAIVVAERMAGTRWAPIDIIIDLRQAKRLPNGSLLASGFRASARRFARQTTGTRRRIVIVGANPVILSMVTMFRRLTGDRGADVRCLDNLEQARLFLSSTTIAFPQYSEAAESDRLQA